MAHRPPDWRLPPGVTPGTWDYVHSEPIASQYAAFLESTALTQLDEALLAHYVPRASTPGSLVADFGCGNGRSFGVLAKLGYRTLGIDLSQPMLRTARERCQGLTALSSQTQSPLLVRANLAVLDAFQDQTVAHGICLFSTLGMIHKRKHRREALQHMHRMIQPGGRLILHVHHLWSALREPGGLRHLASSMLHSTKSKDWDFGDRVYGYRGLPNMFLHRFRKRELGTDLRLAEFTNCRWTYINIEGNATQSAARAALKIFTGGFMVTAERSQHIAT